jgi:leader peptidase (prepilin peptidase)/N-methyltransferase
MAEEERRMGVPLVPDRAASRSFRIRSAGERVGSIGVRHLLLAGGATVALAVVVFGVVVTAIPAPAAFAMACLIPAAVIDIEQRRLPDEWVVAAAIVFLCALVATSVVGPQADSVVDTGIAGGAAAMALPVLAVHLVSPSAMGFGDVKVAVVLGAAVGTVDWRLGVVALCFAALAGAVLGLTAGKRTIAFGPFLLFGAMMASLAHDQIAEVIFAGGAR